MILLDFKQYQRLFCWVRKPPAWPVEVKAFDLVQAPSFNAGTNSLRKEKGVCGKNLCGFFLRDFNQRPLSMHFAFPVPSPPRVQQSDSRRKAKKSPPECSFRRSSKQSSDGNFFTEMVRQSRYFVLFTIELEGLDTLLDITVLIGFYLLRDCSKNVGPFTIVVTVACPKCTSVG